MATYTLDEGTFTDLESNHWFKHPTVMITAEDLAVIDISVDDFFFVERTVIWKPVSGNPRRMVLRPFQMPTGASDLTMGSFTTSSTTGDRTYTSATEGRLIAETGVQVPTAGSPNEGEEIAGMLLGRYTSGSITNDRYNPKLSFVQDTLEAGDIIWVVKEGRVQLDGGAAITDGDILGSSDAVAGEVLTAAAIDTTSPASLNTTLAERLFNGPKGKAIAVARETTAGAGLVLADLYLPTRMSR